MKWVQSLFDSEWKSKSGMSEGEFISKSSPFQQPDFSFPDTCNHFHYANGPDTEEFSGVAGPRLHTKQVLFVLFFQLGNPRCIIKLKRNSRGKRSRDRPGSTRWDNVYGVCFCFCFPSGRGFTSKTWSFSIHRRLRTAGSDARAHTGASPSNIWPQVLILLSVVDAKTVGIDGKIWLMGSTGCRRILSLWCAAVHHLHVKQGIKASRGKQYKLDEGERGSCGVSCWTHTCTSFQLMLTLHSLAGRFPAGSEVMARTSHLVWLRIRNKKGGSVRWKEGLRGLRGRFIASLVLLTSTLHNPSTVRTRFIFFLMVLG